MPSQCGVVRFGTFEVNLCAQRVNRDARIRASARIFRREIANCCTLALEASTILESARLLEEERGKQKIEEELKVARQIQQSLYPRSLPSVGWFVACGSSVASLQVGGDYFDVLNVN